jgi:phenylacetate-CoA ligase
MEAIAAIMEAERPDVLVGYGAWIDLFFRTVTALDLPLVPPRLVMYMGEALPHGARALIEGRFGVPVLSRYNAVEAFKIGFFCEHRTGFHVHEDLCHVRIVGDDGGALAAGEPGHVVISNLINRGSVLLNYPIGDVASLSENGCPCGRSFQLLSELEGRAEDVLPLADGRFVHPRAVWQVLKEEHGVLQYRLTQIAAGRFSLELVTLDESAYGLAVEHARPGLERLLGPNATIDTKHAAAIERGRGGKFRAVRSLGGPPGADATEEADTSAPRVVSE